MATGEAVSCRSCGAKQPEPGWLQLGVLEATPFGEWVCESPVEPLGGFYCSLVCVATEAVRLMSARAHGLSVKGPRGDFTIRDLPS